MTSSGVLRQTVLACLILSVAVAVIASASGHLDLGLGMAAGLMLGSVNGYFIQGLLNRGRIETWRLDEPALLRVVGRPEAW